MRVKPRLMPSGYVRIFEPEHPLANADGYVLEHRKVLFDAGVEVRPGLHVHHKNGEKTDNRIENLELKSVRAHLIGHIEERGGWVTNQHGQHRLRSERNCERCGSPFMPWKPTSRFCSRLCANQRVPRG